MTLPWQVQDQQDGHFLLGIGRLLRKLFPPLPRRCDPAHLRVMVPFQNVNDCPQLVVLRWDGNVNKRL